MGKTSKTQIDRLGERFKKNVITEADLRMLDDYRLSFGQAYEDVVGKIQQKMGMEPTGRPAKSTSSIIEKLHRESIRLSQMQDIAGCRLVVADIEKQDQVVVSLGKVFASASVTDRRTRPSHGYRAVHVIIESFGKLIEVQVRTELQHLWAELSEKLSDKVDPTIKYGGGDKETRDFLDTTFKVVKFFEWSEKRLSIYLTEINQDRNTKEIYDTMKAKASTVEAKKVFMDFMKRRIDSIKEKRKS